MALSVACQLYYFTYKFKSEKSKFKRGLYFLLLFLTIQFTNFHVFIFHL